MVDIHCHILPNLDDGAPSPEIACGMAEMAIKDGVTRIICTPHASPEYKFNPALVRERRDELQSKFGGRIEFATGCDFHLSYENLQDIRREPHRYTLNQKNYLLVEFADFSIPPSIEQSLHEMQLAGLRPIVTHPERNPLIRSQPERLLQWVRQGCYVQITAQSLHGKFGRAAQEMAEKWMGENIVHFLASDAHNVTSRPLRLKETFEYVAKTWGENIAQALLVENPGAVYDGQPLPYAPEAPEDDATSGVAGGTAGKRKRFWFF